MSFAHRHLLGIEQLSPQDISTVLDLADTYVSMNRQAEKHADVLAGLTQIVRRSSPLALNEELVALKPGACGAGPEQVLPVIHEPSVGSQVGIAVFVLRQ